MSENFEQLLASIAKFRKSKQITTSQVSKDTRINKDYLDAIEALQIDQLPQGYEKIFIKSYLKYLGLDSEDNLKIVSEFFEIEQNQENTVQSKTKESLQFDLSQFKTVIVWAPIILVIIFLVYIVYSNFELKKTLPIKELTVKEGLATVDTSTYEKPDTLFLKIRSLDDVYVFVKIDTVEQFSRLMTKNQVWKLQAKNQFNIYANYAGRIQIDLFGKDLGVIGASTQRLNYLIVDQSGIKRKGLSQVKAKGISEQ